MRKIYLLFVALLCTIQAGSITISSVCRDEPEVRDIEFGSTESVDYMLHNYIESCYSGLFQLCPYMTHTHDMFGKRSIDLMSDLWSSDIALTKFSYGWFEFDARMQLEKRQNIICEFYYRWLSAINYGIINFPSSQTEEPFYYAQLLGLRGYMYSCLAIMYGARDDAAKCCPIFITQKHKQKFDRFGTREEVYSQAIADLESAISIFEGQGVNYTRENKLYVDCDVLYAILAQTYLSAAVGSTHEEAYLQKAFSCAEKTIDSKKYKILSHEELLTSGFNNVESPNWMWGIDVNENNRGQQRSFFAHTDIYTYSYAWLGDTKAIDANLYEQIPVWDTRKEWFNASSPYPLTPSKKFFSARNTSLNGNDLDKDYLSDDVFLRIEAMYLVAAEAQWRLGDYEKSLNYLTLLLNHRVNLVQYKAVYEAALDEWKQDPQKLKEQIIYNWRIELWGEGYGYETMRRWKHERERGNNHFILSGFKIKEEDIDNKLMMIYNEADLAKNPIPIYTGDEVKLTLYSNLCEQPQGIYTGMTGDGVALRVDDADNNNFMYWEYMESLEQDTNKMLLIELTRDIAIKAYFKDEDAIPTILLEKNSSHKILDNGQLYILHNGEIYDAQGARVE